LTFTLNSGKFNMLSGQKPAFLFPGNKKALAGEQQQKLYK
jgi:hypothetical protein